MQWLLNLLGLSKSTPRQTTRSRSDAWNEIANTDLEPVIVQLVTKQGWTRERSDLAAHDYRQFLFLITQYPGKTLVPWTLDLDEVWHTHMLDTRRYMADCKRIFGAYLHHNPDLPKGTPRQQHFLGFTREVRGLEFGPKPTATTPLVMTAHQRDTTRKQVDDRQHSSSSAACSSCSSYIPTIACTGGLNGTDFSPGPENSGETHSIFSDIIDFFSGSSGDGSSCGSDGGGSSCGSSCGGGCGGGD